LTAECVIDPKQTESGEVHPKRTHQLLVHHAGHRHKHNQGITTQKNQSFQGFDSVSDFGSAAARVIGTRGTARSAAGGFPARPTGG